MCAFLLIAYAESEEEMNAYKEELYVLEEEGKFNHIKEIIDDRLECEKLCRDDREELLWEKERIRRIARDYRFTREDLLSQLQRRVQDFHESELEEWTENGKLSHRYIDGELRYFYAAASNMFFRNPAIYRRSIGFDRPNPHPEIVREIIGMQRFEKDYYVWPIRRTLRFDLEVTASLKEGDLLEVWIPYPRPFPFQSDIQTVSASSDLKYIAPAESPMRTAYFKRQYSQPGDEKFHITFSYTSWGRYRDICRESVKTIDPHNPDYSYYLQERKPHVVFHPQIIAMVDEIIGNEQNPYIKARRIYDWMLDNFEYSFAPEYSTQRNISYETFRNRYGDCGQLTLLFMTMLRYAGIPARWQSGWVVYPHRRGLHDWCEMYIPPYGWLAVDVTVMIGLQSRNQDEKMEDEELNNVRDFYFGNMHPHVFVANADHGRDFIPSKSDFRSDTVDSQRGEVQINGQNVYYDGFSRTLSVQENDEDK